MTNILLGPLVYALRVRTALAKTEKYFGQSKALAFKCLQNLIA